MCGRYVAIMPPEVIRGLFRTSNPPPNAAPSWNVAPTQSAMVVRRHPESGERHLDLLHWGLVPHFTRSLAEARKPINARSETAAASGMFRGALQSRRCLVPADAFYEWQAGPDGKQPFAIARKDGAPLAFAGLWEGWRAPDGSVLRSFAILTTAADAALSQLHARMPVMLEPDDWADWLDAGTMRASGGDALRTWRVGRAVGNVRNDGPALLEAVQ